MRWLKMMKAFWRWLTMRMSLSNNSVQSDSARCLHSKNPVFNVSSTRASVTRDDSPFLSNIMALTREDGLVLIRSISKICRVEIRKRKPSKTQLFRQMTTSSSTVTRPRLKLVSSSGWQGKKMLLNSLQTERTSTPSLLPRYMIDRSQRQILWNGSLARPVFWV